METKNLIVFINENADFITVYYAGGKKEYYLNDKENRECISSIITKQNEYLKKNFSQITKEGNVIQARKSLNKFISIITILSSIIAIRQSFLFSVLMLLVSLLNAYLYSLKDNSYQNVFNITSAYLKLEHFLFYQGIYDSIDFSDIALYKGITPKEKGLIIKNLNCDNKLDLISAFNLPYHLLSRIEQNYYDILRYSPKKVKAMCNKQNTE